MQHGATRSDGLLDLILLSLRDRGALCALVLAAYRIELTSLLDRLSTASVGEEDAFLVYDLAARIAEAAGAARLTVIRRDALSLREKAAEAHAGGERAEREMLAAGLRVIDRILEAARAHHAARSEPTGPDLN
jgi:hypothetical protein